MAKLNEIYACAVCGNMIEVTRAASGTLVCCGEPMKLEVENTVDASLEKHVPVITETEKGYMVKIGSVPHPMEEAHYIEWVEIFIDGKVGRKYLKPGEASEAEFFLKGKEVKARAYCNLHGLWEGKL